MTQCVTCSRVLNRKFHRCYGCLGSVCEGCVYAFRFLSIHNPVVFCSSECCNQFMGKRKAEADAEYFGEDIGTDDSERSEDSDSAGTSTEDFVVTSSEESSEEC